MTTTRPDRGLRHISEIMEEMGLMKLTDCTVKRCPHIRRGGKCGYRRIAEGPRKGEYPSVGEVTECPAKEQKR